MAYRMLQTCAPGSAEGRNSSNGRLLNAEKDGMWVHPGGNRGIVPSFHGSKLRNGTRRPFFVLSCTNVFGW